MHITYDIKNGIEYAKLCVSTREGKKVSKQYQNLGRVIDKEKGVYKNRKRGIFSYDLDTNTYGVAPADILIPQITGKEKLILDFGDIFLLDWFVKDRRLDIPINATGYGNLDTLHAMIGYYVLCGMANTHAKSWWEGSYARFLYPKANLTSQRISDFLTAIGNEHSQRSFFHEYFKTLNILDIDPENVLIDSTGLPNSIQFPLTAVRNHNGDISEEVRLIYVVDQRSGLPIFFRYCAGNIIDISTLIRCLEELKEQGINIEFAILDAGYYSEANICELFKKEVSFITRMKSNKVIYKELMKQHFDTLEEKENLVEYNGRYIYLKRVKCKLEGYDAYAYIGLDMQRKFMEANKTFQRAKDKKMNTDQIHEAMRKQGAFMIISSHEIETTQLLPLYYTRQQVEQVFDVGKNYANMLPLRTHNEDTFRGHLLLTFITTVIVKLLQNSLINSNINPISLFLNLRNHKCKVYDDHILTHEAFKKANDCYKLFGIKCPTVINL